MNRDRLRGGWLLAILTAILGTAALGSAPFAQACTGSECYQTASIFGASPPVGHGVFRFPQAIAFTPGGSYVFVADQYSSVVQKFDRQGAWQFDIGWHADRGQLRRLGVIGGLATDRNNHLYVLDSENDRVQVFRSDTGEWIGAFGSTGTGSGYLNLGANTGVGGLAVHQPNAGAAPLAYVADQYNHRIVKLTLDQLTTNSPNPLLSRQRVLPRGLRNSGEPNNIPVPSIDTTWGRFGDCHTVGCSDHAYDYWLNFPQGITVNPRPDGQGRNNVYVADDDNHRVVEYTPGGSYLAQVGSYGSGAGQFRFPYDVGIDGHEQNHLYVADNNNHRTQRFDAATLGFQGMWGSFGPEPGNLEFPRALAALSDDPLGGVYVADTANNRVQGFDADGHPTAAWGIAGRGPGYVTRPAGVAVDGSGNLYVADTFAHRIEKFSPAGAYLGQWGYISSRSGFAAPNSGNGQFNFPHGIAFNPASGNFWVADTLNNRVQELSPAGEWISTHTDFSGPRAVAADPGGAILVADTANDRVRRRDPGGGWSTLQTGGYSLSRPAGIAADGAGTVFIADTGNDRVIRSSGGSVTAVVPISGGFSAPAGLSLAGSRLYVADAGSSRVLRLDTHSSAWDVLGTEGNAPGQFVGPSGAVVSPAGDALYVADTLNNRVQRLSGLGLSAYPRPKGATPILVSLVPAYKACSASNRTHGPSLSYSSCNPAVQVSPHLTVGTPDANGARAGSSGSIRLDVCPATGCLAPDVKINAAMTDVRRKSGLSDYAGELQTRFTLRLTDRNNATSPGGGTDPATVSDTSLAFTVPCIATTDPSVGSTCGVSTTVNSVSPGTVTDGNRSIWELGQIAVFDGGPDGLASTADNTLFESQGVFVP